ncbi:MAG: PQQ-binding-like beta-propeller repeat protein [Pseudomonadota bacterium]
MAERRRRGRWLVLLALLGTGMGCRNDAERSVVLAAQGVYAGALSTDGELAVIGSMNHGASLWRVRSHERLYSWNHASDTFSTLVATAFSPDGKRAATSDPRTLVIWDTQTGKDLAFWGLPAAALDLALANDGRRVLLGLEDHSAILFDAASGAHLQTLLHEGAVGAVAMTVDGTVAATGSDDENVRLWDLATGALRLRLQLDNPVRALALSDDGALLFAASQGRRVGIWRTADGVLLKELYARNPGITSARFSADGERLLIGAVNGETDLYGMDAREKLAQWSLQSTGSLTGSGKAILNLAFQTTDGQFLALTSDGTLHTLSAR